MGAGEPDDRDDDAPPAPDAGGEPGDHHGHHGGESGDHHDHGAEPGETTPPPLGDAEPAMADHGDGFALAGELPDAIPLGPGEVAELTQEIRAVAESRSQDDDLPELPELPVMPELAAETLPAVPGQPEPLDVDELREAWPVLDLDERSDGLHILPREDAEDFFASLGASDVAALLQHWRPGNRRQWLRMLDPDDAADVIQASDPEVRPALIAALDAPTRKEVQALLAYEEDQAGGLMSTRYARLRPQMTVDEAVSYLRRQARGELETIYTAYVVAADQILLGVVSFRDLFVAAPTKTVADVMETEVVRVSDEMDQETVSRIFAEHDLNVVPVVDKDGKMKGIVTVDDIVDVVREEATEDAQKFGGMQALSEPYLQARLPEMVRKRGVWLMVLQMGQMLTATALSFFQHQIETAVVLTLFMPLVISSGGNSGSQASTLVIRAMALGEVRSVDLARVLRRELLTGLALGLLLGAFGLLRVVLWPHAASAYGPHYFLLGCTVAASLVAAVIFGTLLGAGLPFVLRKIGADPASASAPFVATLSDVTGLVIYFSVANLILAGSML